MAGCLPDTSSLTHNGNSELETGKFYNHLDNLGWSLQTTQPQNRNCLEMIPQKLAQGLFFHLNLVQPSCLGIFGTQCIFRSVVRKFILAFTTAFIFFSSRDRKNSCDKRLHSKEQWEANNNPKSQLNLHMTTIYQRNCSSNSPITHDVYNIQELIFFLIPCNETI